MPAQADAILVMLGVIIAVAVFGALLLLGVAVVRWLRLPQDLPDGPRFEPAPPPLRADDGGDVAGIAERQRRLSALYARGLACLRAAQQCHELAVALPPGAGEAGARVERAAAAAGEAATRAERRMADHADLDAAEAAVAAEQAAAERALAEAEAAAAAAPSAGGRRALLWVVLGIVAVAWLAALIAIAAWRR